MIHPAPNFSKKNSALSKLVKQTTKQFQKTVRDFYKQNKRHFPWRETNDPYQILVSEIMLQQTQTARVVIKYQEFLSKFPNLESLAKAKLSEVLQVWVGLGYNRRAKFLHECAKYVYKTHKRVFQRLWYPLWGFQGSDNQPQVLL